VVEVVEAVVVAEIWETNMATKKINPIEEHFEKGVVGFAAIVLFYALFAYTISSPTNITIDGQIARPGQAYELVLRKAELIDSKVREQAEIWANITLAKPSQDTNVQSTLTGLPENLKSPLTVIVPLNNELVTDDPNGNGLSEKYDIPKVLSPEKLSTRSGRSVLDLKQDEPLASLLQVTDKDMKVEKSWVTVGGTIDLIKQRKEMVSLPDKYEVEKEPLFIRADLQRAEVLADGKLGPWADVECILDEKGLLIPPTSPLKVDSFKTLEEVRHQLMSRLSEIEGYALTPEFPIVIAGDDWKDPFEKEEVVSPRRNRNQGEEQATMNRRERTPSVRRGGTGGDMAGPGGRTGGRSSRSGGGKGVGSPVLGGGGRGVRRPNQLAVRGGAEMGGPGMMGPGMVNPGMMGPGMAGPGMMGPGMVSPGMMPGVDGRRGGMSYRTAADRKPVRLSSEQRKKEKTLKVWVHDLTARPGKTYKYRLRVVMYNPLAGYKPIMKTPQNNLVAGLVSPWSEPIGPVTVEREGYIFAGSISDDSKSVNFTVYKWNAGWLYQATFDRVKVGQAIGGKKVIGKGYQRLPDGTLQESRNKEIDFTTGAVLEAISKNDVTIRMDDSSVIKQELSTISSDKDFKKCKDILIKQRQDVAKGNVVGEAKAGEESEEP